MLCFRGAADQIDRALWDVTGRRDPPKAQLPGRLSDKEWNNLWYDLGSVLTPPRCVAAVRALLATSKQSLPLLAEKLRPVSDGIDKRYFVVDRRPG